MKRPFQLIIFAAVAIIGIYLTAAWLLRAGPFATHYRIFRAYFDNVNGLKRADPVTLFGFEVGSVQGFEQQQNGVIVIIGIEPSVQLYADATAEIQVKEILGGKQIALFPGKSKKNFNPTMLLAGNQTFDLTAGIAKMGNLLAEFTPERTQQLLSSVDKITNILNSIPEPKITQLIGDAAESAATLKILLEETKQIHLINKIQTLIQHLDSTLFLADKRLTQVETFLNLGLNTLQSVDSVLTHSEKLIIQGEKILTDAQMTLDTLKYKQTLIHKILYDTSFVRTVEQTLDNLNQTMVHVRRKKIHVTMSFSHKQKKEYPEK